MTAHEMKMNPILNIAAVTKGTRVLGPGIRSAVWVQGCLHACPDCIAPEWQPIKPAQPVRVTHLVDYLLSGPPVDGLTLSGGEPMLQAGALAKLVTTMRAYLPELDVICFSGYKLKDLQTDPPSEGVSDLLSVIDVLIDGQYISSLDDGKGLRGSSNQRVHYITERLSLYDLESGPRMQEIQMQGSELLIVGLPTADSKQAVDQAVLGM